MSSSSQAPESWITSFCSLLGHEYFAEVSEDFIEDDFNLTGLQSHVHMYKEALEMILDVEPEEDEDDEDEDEEEEEDEALGDDGRLGYRRAGDRRHMRMASDLSVIESSAELLYGLIHQRYITSRPGIQQMAEKYELQHFGVCPRVHCNGCRVLPVGCSDTPGQDTVKLFCPSCLDVYTPPNSRFQSLDGAFFGTTFGCLFFMTFPELDVGRGGDSFLTATTSGTASATNADRATRSGGAASTGANQLLARGQPSTINGMVTTNLAPGLGQGKIYEPRIYGFKVSERARSGPRMKWLRMRPDDINELDEQRRFHELQQHQAAQDDGDDEADAEVDVSMASSQAAAGENNAADANAIARRKKAPIRRRRQAGSGTGVAVGGGSPMDTNGAG